MLIGQYEHTIDQKKRLSLPSKFRKELGKKVIITKELDNCLVIYSGKEWAKTAEKIKNLPLKFKALSRMMLGSAMEVDLDKLGRILVPDYLKKYAGLRKNVTIRGLLNKLEIWDAQTWETYEKGAERGASKLVSELDNLGI